MNSSLRSCLTRTVLVASFLMAFAAKALCENYYVDAVNGDDSRTGKLGFPWKTLAKIGNGNIVSGDVIHLQRGCTWREQLPVPASNLVFDTCGSTGVRPIVDAGDSLRGLAWSGQGGIWTAPLNVAQFPGRVWLQGTELGIAGDQINSAFFPNSQYRWNYTGTSIQIYSSSNPGTIGVANVLLSNGDFRHAVYFENQSNITFRNIDFRRGDVCIEIHNGQNIYFENCAIGLGTSRMGMLLADGSNNGHIFGCQLDRMDTVYHSFQYAGNYGGGNSCDCLTMQSASYWDIHNNIFADPGHSCVSLSALDPVLAPNWYLVNNKIHDNECFMRSGDYGRAFDVQATLSGHATGNLFYNNYIHNFTVFSQIGGNNNAFYYNIWDTTRLSPDDANNVPPTTQRSGFVLFWANSGYGSTNNRVCNNTFMNAQGPAVTVNNSDSKPQGFNLIANNLFYNNGQTYDNVESFRHIQLWTYPNSANHDTIWNNLFFQPNGDTNQISYLNQVETVDAFNKAHLGNSDTVKGNLASDPLLDTNYTLPYYSPAVDSGANVGLSLDRAGTPVPFGNKPDIGAYESLALRAEISGNDVVLTWAAPPSGNDLTLYTLVRPNRVPAPIPSAQTSTTDQSATPNLGPSTEYRLIANSTLRGTLGSTRVKVIKPPSTISASSTWSGTVYLPNTVTINSGVAVTMYPGTRVRGLSPTGGLLNVSGSLTSLGTLNYPTSFDRSTTSGVWGGITLNSGSSASVLSYCKVLHANRGIYENGVSVDISNSAIDSCTEGIYLYNSSPKIHKCNIHDNTDAGVYVISCSNPPYPILDSNYIQNNYYGIYCTTNSNPKLGNGSAHGDNYIANNTNGLFCWNNSLPMLGESSPVVDGGYNNFVNLGGNQWNVYNMTGYAIYGQNNWWGSTNQYNFRLAGTGSTI